MGSFQYFKRTGGKFLKKINAPLNEKLNNVEWGEYKLGDLFEVKSYKKRFDANKVTLVKRNGHPYIVRQGHSNGQKGFIDEDAVFLNEGNTISFGQDTATVYYQKESYFTGDKIKIFKSKYEKFSSSNALFFVSAITRAFSNYSWGTVSYSEEKIKSQKILLPIKNNAIDFDFMENFIAELEAERIKELEAYLKATGVTNYELTLEEKRVLEEKVEFKEFMISDIFKINNTKCIGKNLITFNSGTIPYVTASANNNGIVTYIDCPNEWLDKGNCIMIGGKTLTFTYQEKDFCSNDSHNISLYMKDDKQTKREIFCYMMSALRKSLSGKYSWGNSISSAKIETDSFYLPIKNNLPDYEYMETYISAVQKLIIAGVVRYADEKINATKQIIEKQ